MSVTNHLTQCGGAKASRRQQSIGSLQNRRLALTVIADKPIDPRTQRQGLMAQISHALGFKPKQAQAALTQESHGHNDMFILDLVQIIGNTKQALIGGIFEE